MKVPQHILIMAKTYLSHGDISKIIDSNDCSRYEIQQVLSGEDSTPEAIAAVAKYYKEKEEILSDYIN
jgi:hypothetical protein